MHFKPTYVLTHCLANQRDLNITIICINSTPLHKQCRRVVPPWHLDNLARIPQPVSGWVGEMPVFLINKMRNNSSSLESGCLKVHTPDKRQVPPKNLLNSITKYLSRKQTKNISSKLEKIYRHTIELFDQSLYECIKEKYLGVKTEISQLKIIPVFHLCLWITNPKFETRSTARQNKTWVL